MKMLDVKESLFFLSESQQEDYNKLQFYDFYFHLIRHDFLKHPYAQYSLADFWIFYYYEEVPVTNTENTLIYLFRHFLLEAVLKDSKFKRIKKSTVNASSRAMMPADLFVLSKSEKKDILMARLIAHIELAINLNKLDYAFQFYERHFSSNPAEMNSRVYEGALAFYNELLIICMEQKLYKDLIFTCFDRIVLCYENLKKEQLIPNILDEKRQVIGKLKVDLSLIEKYLSGKSSHTIQQNHPFLHTKEEFEQIGQHYSSDTTGEGITLIVVDFVVKQDNEELVAAIMELLQKEMQQQFATDLLASTQLNDTTVGYLVKLSESVCNERSTKVQSIVHAQFSKNEAALQSIYFSSVNNKTHQLFHYKKMRDLAFAFIYYTLYK